MGKSQRQDKSNISKSQHYGKRHRANNTKDSKELTAALTGFVDEFAAFHEMNTFLIHALTELLSGVAPGSQEDRRGARLLSEHVLLQAVNLKQRAERLRTVYREEKPC